MKKLSAYISVVFLALCMVCRAQEPVSSYIDSELDRYETLCGMCLDLKTRIRQGENVSKAEAEAFINRFLVLNRELKTREGQMTAAQKRRFSMVARWFSTGTKPSQLEDLAYDSLPARKPSGFPCCACTMEDGAQLLDVPFPDAAFRGKTYLMASVDVPDLSYGLWVGHLKYRWGGFLSFRSNYVFDKISYSCSSDGSLSGLGRFWGDGKKRQSNLMLTGGAMVGLNRWLSVYAGLGYGWRRTDWRDLDGEWVDVDDLSYKGMACDAGIILSRNRFAFSAGVSTISFKTVSMNIGLGVCF